MRKQSYLSVFLATATVLAGASAFAADDVKALWIQNCASCHGEDGKAATKVGQLLKVRSLLDPEVRAKFDRERMINATKQGIPQEGSSKMAMKGYADKLTDEQIAALIDYIYALGN